MVNAKKSTPVGVVPQDLYDCKKDKSSRESAIYQQYWAGYTGGTLRDAWTILPIEKQGNNYLVIFVNNTEYASCVEYRHRQRPGRYVPAIVKALKTNWVKGGSC